MEQGIEVYLVSGSEKVGDALSFLSFFCQIALSTIVSFCLFDLSYYHSSYSIFIEFYIIKLFVARGG